MYSHGQSEIILGNAIKKLNLPRDELVILTKVCIYALFVTVCVLIAPLRSTFPLQREDLASMGIQRIQGSSTNTD